jgi:rod shape-determining protein MreD
MREKSPVKYVFLIGLLLAFFLDGSIPLLFGNLLYARYILVTNLTFMWLFFGMYFINRNNIHILWWSALAGLLYDWYYMGIIGVYVLLLPIAIYLGKLLYKYLPYNIMASTFSYLVGLVTVNGLSFMLARLMNVTNMSGHFFLFQTFIPTVIFNLIIFLLLYVPIGVMFDKIE